MSVALSFLYNLVCEDNLMYPKRPVFQYIRPVEEGAGEEGEAHPGHVDGAGVEGEGGEGGAAQPHRLHRGGRQLLRRLPARPHRPQCL